MDNLPKPDITETYTIYGSETCPFCVKAKELLNEKEIKYIYHDVKTYGTLKEALDYLANLTNNQRTIPVIFKKDKFIGGYDDLKKIIDNQELRFDAEF